VDESLLPPPEAPSRPFPWRAFALILVPAAALAVGTGISWLAGTAHGDALLRWLSWSSAVGLVFGAGCGAIFGRRLLWAAHGALSPWLVAALVLAGARLSEPLRDALADHREAQCSASGRRTCTAEEFRSACVARDRALLGVPAQSLCQDAACTHRWIYPGPFRPDAAARTRLLCSIVTDAAGNGLRSSLVTVAGEE